MPIEVNFDQYCPSIGTVYQYNLILLNYGYIAGIQVCQEKTTKQYLLQIHRNELKKSEHYDTD